MDCDGCESLRDELALLRAQVNEFNGQRVWEEVTALRQEVKELISWSNEIKGVAAIRQELEDVAALRDHFVKWDQVYDYYVDTLRSVYKVISACLSEIPPPPPPPLPRSD